MIPDLFHTLMKDVLNLCSVGLSQRNISLRLNLLAAKLFIVASATKGGDYHHPLRFRIRFKTMYRVIKPLIRHCLLRKMVYLNIIYVIAT